MAGFFRNLKLCMMFNLLFILVYFFQLHLKDFFLSQMARLFGRWFILGSIILTVCHNGVVFTILRVVKNNRRRWLPKRESYDEFRLYWHCVPHYKESVSQNNEGQNGYEGMKTTQKLGTRSCLNCWSAGIGPLK